MARHGIPLLAHAELDGPVELPPGDGRSYRRYLASRPSAWEVSAIRMLIELCRRTGCAVHIVHLATADALEMITAARTEGLPLTVETCPHYLHFRAEDIPDGDTRYKCAPPIREAAHREALWAALQHGAIDLVASDHSPCPPEMKDPDGGDFFKAWGGISSLQLGLPIMMTECRRRGIPLERIARWMGEGPARLAGQRANRGAITVGGYADLVVVDPQKSFRVEGSRLRHRHKITPYEGETLFGVVEATYLRGRRVYEPSAETIVKTGRMVRRPDRRD
jgi:allantoinase